MFDALLGSQSLELLPPARCIEPIGDVVDELRGALGEVHPAVVDRETFTRREHHAAGEHPVSRMQRTRVLLFPIHGLAVVNERLHVVEQHEPCDCPVLVWVTGGDELPTELLLGERRAVQHDVHQELELGTAVEPALETLALRRVDDLAPDERTNLRLIETTGVVAPVAPVHREIDVTVEAVVIVLLEVDPVVREAEVVAPRDAGPVPIRLGNVGGPIGPDEVVGVTIETMDGDREHIFRLSCDDAVNLGEGELLPELPQRCDSFCAHSIAPVNVLCATHSVAETTSNLDSIAIISYYVIYVK